ncbi:MAG: hypothetical protein AAGC68_08370, partial [Verrucomicrobiota bacterium]
MQFLESRLAKSLRIRYTIPSVWNRMGYEIVTDLDLGLVRVITEGEMKAEEFEQMIPESRDCCRAHGILKVLTDCSGSTGKQITTSEVREIAAQCEQLNGTLDGGQLAVVLKSDLDYGMARMWQAYAEERLRFASSLFR